MHTIDSAIVGHIDLLGFRTMVTAPGDRQELAIRLDAAMRRALEAFGGLESLSGTPDGEWRVRVFSDCLCVAKPLSEIGVAVTLEAIALFTQDMLFHGFLIRGGIEIGPYSDTELMIFSSAQIEAYDLEAKVARVPRTVVSSRVVSYMETIEDDTVRQFTKEYVVVDPDEVHFVNYLVFYEEDDWLGGARFYQETTRLLSSNVNNQEEIPTVRDKFVWMAQFHNWSLRHTAKVMKLDSKFSEDTVWAFTDYLVVGNFNPREFVTLLWTDKSFQPPEETAEMKSIDWLREWPKGAYMDDQY